MRQINETATSFNELKAITQAIMLKKGAPKNATNQESDRTQTSANANISDLMQATASKPKASAQTKNHALKPTKKAFSERQITAFRDNSQDSANSSFKTKASHNANAIKSDEALKPGLKNTQENQKGGNNEA